MHVKNKEIQDPYSDKTFTQLTSDIMQKYFTRLKRNIDLIAVAYIDREIFTEKTGKKDAKGKEITKGVIKEETRKIKFRDSNYAIDAGGRLKYIVDEIPFTADDFIAAIEDALKKEVENNGVSIADREKEDIENEKVAAKKAAENSRKAKEIKEASKEVDEARNTELIQAIKPLFLSDETSQKVKDKVKTYMKENGVSFKAPESTSTKHLEEIFKMLS